MRLWRARPILSHDNRSPASQFTGLPMTLSPVDLALEFPQAPNLLYFNHAAVAPWPRRAAEAVTRFAAENVRNGALDYRRWLDVERSLRDWRPPRGVSSLAARTCSASTRWRPAWRCRKRSGRTSSRRACSITRRGCAVSPAHGATRDNATGAR